MAGSDAVVYGLMIQIHDTQDVQSTTAPSAGRDQKMRPIAECGYFIERPASWWTASWHQISDRNVNFIFLDQAYRGKFQSSMERAKLAEHGLFK